MQSQSFCSRRRFLAGVAGFGAATLVAACQPQERVVEVEKVVTQVVEKPVEKIVEREKIVTQVVEVGPQKVKGKLVFWGHDNHPVDNAVPGFKERNPEIEFESQHIGDWLTKFKATLASGTDVPDLVWLEASTIQELGGQGVLLDVTEIVKPNTEKFVAAKLAEVFIVRKQMYAAYPSDLALVGLWYRQDIMESAGIQEFPESLKFDDFIRIIVQVKETTGAAGFLLPANGWDWPFQILLAQLGGSYTTPDGTSVTIDDEKGVAAMAAIKQVWDTGATLDTDWLQPPYWGAVKAGKLGTDYMPAWMRGFVRGETSSVQEGLGQWRVVPLPEMPGGESRTAQVGGASLTSTKFTKYPDAVKSFMEFAFGTIDGTIATGSWGIIPSYLPYLESTVFQNQTDPVFGDYRFAKVWAEVAPELSPNYVRMPVFSEANTIIRQNMMPILRGEVALQDGMKSIGDKVRQVNERYQ